MSVSRSAMCVLWLFLEAALEDEKMRALISHRDETMAERKAIHQGFRCRLKEIQWNDNSGDRHVAETAEIEMLCC